MKYEIIEIADRLKSNEITADDAQKELISLFGVDYMLRRLKNHCEVHNYPSESFRVKLKQFIKKYCQNEQK